MLKVVEYSNVYSSKSSPALISIATVCASNIILALLLRACGGGRDKTQLRVYDGKQGVVQFKIPPPSVRLLASNF